MRSPTLLSLSVLLCITFGGGVTLLTDDGVVGVVGVNGCGNDETGNRNALFIELEG